MSNISSNLKNGLPFKARVIAVAVTATLGGSCVYAYNKLTTEETATSSFPTTKAKLNIKMDSANNLSQTIPDADNVLLNGKDVIDTYKKADEHKLEVAEKTGSSYVSQLTYEKSRDLVSYVDYLKTKGKTPSFELALKWMGPANPRDYKDFTTWVGKQDNKKTTFHNYILWLKVERPEIYSKFAAWAEYKELKMEFKNYMSWLSYITSMSEIQDFDNFLKWSTADGRQSEFDDFQEWLASAKPDEFNQYNAWLKKNGLKPSWDTYSKYLQETNPEAYSEYQKWLKENGLDDNYDNYMKFIAESNKLNNGSTVSDYADWLKEQGISPNTLADAKFSDLLKASNPELFDNYQRWLDYYGLTDTPENYKKFISDVLAQNDAKMSEHSKLMAKLKANDPDSYNQYQRWLKEKGLKDTPESYQKYLESLKSSKYSPQSIHDKKMSKLKLSDPEAYDAYKQWLKENGLTDTPEAYQQWLKEKATKDAKAAHAKYISDLLTENPELLSEYKEWLRKNNLEDSPEAFQQFLSERNKSNGLDHKSMMDSIKSSNPELYNAYQKWLKENGLDDSPESYRAFLESLKYDPITDDDSHSATMKALKETSPEIYDAYQKWLKENGLTDSPEAYQQFIDELKNKALLPYHKATLEVLKEADISKYNEYKKWLMDNNLKDSIDSYNKHLTDKGISNASADALHRAFIESLKNSDKAKYNAYQKFLKDNNLSDTPEAYQKFLDSLAPSHSTYMKWLKENDPSKYSAYQQWLKDNNLEDSAEAYQRYLSETQPSDAERYKQWLLDNNLDDSYENYLKFLASQEDTISNILEGKNLCVNTSMRIFSKAMYATNQSPSYVNFREWMKNKSSCGDKNYQEYLNSNNKVDSFATYETFLQNTKAEHIRKFHKWLNSNSLISSWDNFLYWSLLEEGLSDEEIRSLLGESLLDYLNRLDCKKPTFINYSTWASQNDDQFKAFSVNASKTGVPLTFGNMMNFMQSAAKSDHNDYINWLKSNELQSSFTTFIKWKASTNVAGLNQCSISALDKTLSVSNYFDYISTEGLGANYKSYLDFIATNDPDEFSKYKKWLKDNNLPNNEKSYLQYLEAQNPEMMDEYKKWLKENGLNPGIDTLAMFKAQKEGMNPSNKALRKLTNDLRNKQQEQWKSELKNSLLQKPTTESTEAVPTVVPTHVKPTTKGNFEQINRELAIKQSIANSQAFVNGDFMKLEIAGLGKLAGSISTAVKNAAKDNYIDGSSIYVDTGKAASSNSNITGISKYDRFLKDRTPDYSNLDAVKRAKQRSANNKASETASIEPRHYYPGDKIEKPVTTTRINAGTILYSNLVIGVNTDEISTVKSIIIEEGPLKGATLLGQPSISGRYGETAIIKYSKLILNNEEYAIDAYAVDPQSMRAALAGDVDRHIFERYTKLGIAAFASGYAESLSNKSESKNSDGSKDVEIGAIETAKDRAMYAGGKMMSAFIPFFERGFDRPATVSIPSGSSIGIMFASGFDLNK